MNLETIKSSKKGKKVVATKFGPLAEVVVWGEKVNISETTTNMFLHGPEHSTPTTVGLYDGRHHSVTSEAKMKDQVPRESIMKWITGRIATDNDAISWVANPQVHTTMSTSIFLAKVWWTVVYAQLR